MTLFSNQSNEQRSTAFGVLAILLWSTTIAFSRSLTEQLGTLTAASLIYLAAGLVGIIFMVAQPGWKDTLRKLPPRYLIGCGGLFIIYIICLYLAIGSSSNRVQVLAVGLINYLWPGLSLVFSLPILGKRSSLWLPVGIVIALAGIGLATGSVNQVSAGDFIQNSYSWTPYLLALVAAVSWALYTNLSRRWAGEHEGGAVPLFLFLSGSILLLMEWITPEISQWTFRAGLELAYMALFPGMLAYVLWDIAVRKGRIILIASLSYATPLLSTLTSALVLKVTPGITLWLGALLVFTGAILCKLSIPDRDGHSSDRK